MTAIYFEVKGETLLDELGISKAEFARRMGIKRQNVKTLFKSKDLRTILKAAEVLGMPWQLLVGYVEMPDTDALPVPTPEDNSDIVVDSIPMGDTTEDQRARRKLIKDSYREWGRLHPDGKMFNQSLNDDIYIKFISVDETSAHASLHYLSTLAVLQLDAILSCARYRGIAQIKTGNKNQAQFEKMILMSYDCVGVGRVKLTVGVKRGSKQKIQYCITAMDVEKQSSLK